MSPKHPFRALSWESLAMYPFLGFGSCTFFTSSNVRFHGNVRPQRKQAEWFRGAIRYKKVNLHLVNCFYNFY